MALSRIASRLTNSAVLTPFAAAATTNMAQPTRGYKVAIVGAAGGIGQPLALLAKQSHLVSQLSLYDVAPVTPGKQKQDAQRL